jgi:hypothetical protein
MNYSIVQRFVVKIWEQGGESSRATEVDWLETTILQDQSNWYQSNNRLADWLV